MGFLMVEFSMVGISKMSLTPSPEGAHRGARGMAESCTNHISYQSWGFKDRVVKLLSVSIHGTLTPSRGGKASGRGTSWGVRVPYKEN